MRNLRLLSLVDAVVAVVILLPPLLPLLVLANAQGGTVTRSGTGIQIGTSERGTSTRGTGFGGSRAGGVRLGEGRFPNSTRQRTFSTTTSAPSTPSPPRFTYAPQSSIESNHNVTVLKVGLMVPYKSFGVRDYSKAVSTVINTLERSTRGPRLRLFERYDIRVKLEMMELTPSPTA